MNIPAGLKKLDELSCNKRMQVINYPNLREILLALAEPSEDKQFVNKYQDVALQIRNINQRIGDIENKLGSGNPKKEILLAVEQQAERLSRLEERVRKTEIMCDNLTHENLPFNEKYVHDICGKTLKDCRCFEGRELPVGCSKPEKPVMEDYQTRLCPDHGLNADCDCTLEEPSKPSECPNCKETVYDCACIRNKCKRCGKSVGNITFCVCDECWDKYKPSECKPPVDCEDCLHQVCPCPEHKKCAETIEISRKVAEDVVKKLEEWARRGDSSVASNVYCKQSFDLAQEIRKALKGGEK